MLIDASGGVNGLDTRGCTESDRARRSRRVEVPTLQDNPFAHSCCRTHDRRVMSLHYTSGTVLMADDVCEALLRYAQALASSQGSDVVTVPIIDPERGIVFTFAFFDHSGTVRDYPLANGRIVTSSVDRPFTWEIGEAFKIENGLITRIEAVMTPCPYGMPPNWPMMPGDIL